MNSNLEFMLVSKKTSILAKKKGFNLRVFNFYEDGKPFPYEVNLRCKVDCIRINELKGEDFNSGKNEFYETISRPTQNQLQKWLREKHNIHIKVDDFVDDETGIEWDFEVVIIGTYLDERGNYKPLIPYSIDDNNRKFKTYEQALEKGLYKSLKEIKDENNL